jgi:uncharacterized membrane protein YdbT with pleckstrin-like domain
LTFPRRLVRDNEEVLLDAHPHWWQLVGPTLGTVIVVGGCTAIFLIWPGAPRWSRWALLGVGAVAVCWFLTRLARWRATDLVVTTMRVIYRRGVVSRSSREIPLSSVQDVSFAQSLGERLIGKGQLSVQSAAVHGEEPIQDVRRPAVVQGLINRVIEESRRELSDAPGAECPSVPEELERLAALHRRGVITEREFARLEAKIVDGFGPWPDDGD